MTYTLQLRSVGDRWQGIGPSRKTITVDDLAAAREEYEWWRDEEAETGAERLRESAIIADGCEVGRFAYNGRLVCNCGEMDTLHPHCRVPLRLPSGATEDFIAAPPNARLVGAS